LYKFVNILIR